MSDKPLATDDNLIVVLDDGETFGPLQGSNIVALPDGLDSLEKIEEYLEEHEDSLDALPMRSIKDSDTIIRWMRIFFPDMQVEQDNDGQVVIYTGITEGESSEG